MSSKVVKYEAINKYEKCKKLRNFLSEMENVKKTLHLELKIEEKKVNIYL